MSGLQSPINKGRFFFLFAGLVMFWVVLELNLFRYQVINTELLNNYARKQYEKEVPLKAQRGNIYDRNGRKLATNIRYYDIAVDPTKVKNKNFIAKTLASNFSKSKAYYLNKMNQDKQFTYLERKATTRSINTLLSFSDPGLIKVKSFGRHYPYDTYAAQLLGFTNPDDNGLSGLEKQFEEELKGHDGKAILQYDAARRARFNADYEILKPTAGNDIYLTIDKDIQTITEKALKHGVEKMRGKSGIVVVMNPNNGAILSIANYPSINPNNHKKYREWTKKNRAITDVFEPGSTMKMFTAGAILQERLHVSEDIVFCENGRFRVYDTYIHDTKKLGWLTFEKVIEKSSNIGIIKLVDDMPSKTLFRYLKNFGFGSKSDRKSVV